MRFLRIGSITQQRIAVPLRIKGVKISRRSGQKPHPPIPFTHQRKRDINQRVLFCTHGLHFHPVVLQHTLDAQQREPHALRIKKVLCIRFIATYA